MRNWQIRIRSAALLWAGIAAVLCAGVAAGLIRLPVPQHLMRLLAFTQSFRYGGPLLFIALAVLACLLFLPGPVVILAAGFLFGAVRGAATASIGALLGATAAFLIARSTARGWVERRIAHDRLFLAVDRAIADQGFKIVFLLRLCSLFPYSLLSYLLGLTRVPLLPYCLATWLGRLPAMIAYAYLGSKAKDLIELASAKAEVPVEEQILLGLGLVAMITVAWIIARIVTRTLRETMRSQEGGWYARRKP